MPNAQHHRGAHPEDPELFDERARQTLLRACTDVTYLLDRGYSVNSALEVVSRRYELRVRQRTALQRCVCTTAQAQSRSERQCDAKKLAGCRLMIDGFNLIIGIEVALSKGLLLKGQDGAYRDLAGLRGSYHLVEETEQALSLLGQLLQELCVSEAWFYLDQPVSNSGRLKSRILEHAASWLLPVRVEVVHNPDRELFGQKNVVSSDSLVLDQAESWVNLLGVLVSERLDPVWILDLSAPEGAPAMLTTS